MAQVCVTVTLHLITFTLAWDSLYEVGEYLNKEHTDTDTTINCALLDGTFPDGLLVHGVDDGGDTGPSPPAQLPITPDPANKPIPHARRRCGHCGHLASQNTGIQAIGLL